MLVIKELSVIEPKENKQIIRDLNLSLEPGKIHLLMGPNGAGKSTLSKAIMNWPELIIDGTIELDGEDITSIEMFERARKGLFIAHQSPAEIPGVHLVEFVRTAYNNTRPEDKRLDPWTFSELFESVADAIGLGVDFARRNLNEGFSGGEKRKNEVVQMILLDPKYAILDEVDSGLDIDSLKQIFSAIYDFAKDSNCGVLIISHNPKILEYLAPDKVFLLVNGTIVDQGDKTLAERILNEGYTNYAS